VVHAARVLRLQWIEIIMARTRAGSSDWARTCRCRTQRRWLRRPRMKPPESSVFPDDDRGAPRGRRRKRRWWWTAWDASANRVRILRRLSMKTSCSSGICPAVLCHARRSKAIPGMRARTRDARPGSCTGRVGCGGDSVNDESSTIAMTVGSVTEPTAPSAIARPAAGYGPHTLGPLEYSGTCDRIFLTCLGEHCPVPGSTSWVRGRIGGSG
jgi:hypothetical protein